MSQYAFSLKRGTALLAAVTLTALLTVVNFSAFFSEADAAQLSSRKVVLSSNLAGNNTTGLANSETNGADATHTFTFTTPTGGSVKAIEFQYCLTAVGTCGVPLGLDVDSTPAVLTQTDNGTPFGASFAPAATGNTNQLVRFVNSTGNTVTAGHQIVFAFDDVNNPTNNGTYFVHIKLYNSDTTFTNNELIDDGTVSFSITEEIIITARVAETLGFSTTGNFAATAAGSGVDDPGASCSPLTGSGALWLGDTTEHTLDVGTAYDNYSAFRIYTNAGTGATVWYEGPTLTRSAGVTITPSTTEALSAFGTEQFGLGIDTTLGGVNNRAVTSRSTTIDGTYVSTAAQMSGDPGEITAATDYDEAAGSIQSSPAAKFSFTADTPTQIASSAGYVTCNTAAVRYLGNIAPTTEAGTYTTTLVYSAVPTY